MKNDTNANYIAIFNIFYFIYFSTITIVLVFILFVDNKYYINIFKFLISFM